MVGKIMPHYIEIRQGDSFNIALQFKNHQAGEFINLSGSVLKMQVRTKADNRLVLTKQGSIDDAAKGKASINITPNDTKGLNLDEEYVTDIQITFANGEVHTVYPAGVADVAAFIITPNITE